MYDFRLARIIHEERLQEAEYRRRHREYAVDAPPIGKRLLERLGDYLLAVGNKFKALSAPQSGDVTPLRSKNA